MSLDKIEFTQIAIKTVSKYKKSNPVQYKKLVKLLNELMEHPRIGTGHPELLKLGDSITYDFSASYPPARSQQPKRGKRELFCQRFHHAPQLQEHAFIARSVGQENDTSVFLFRVANLGAERSDDAYSSMTIEGNHRFE